MPDDLEQAHVSPVRFRATLAVLFLAVSAYGLLQGLVVPVLPVIQRQMHTSQTGAAWVFTAFLVCSSVATPILGRLGDIFGKARMMLVALGFVAAGSILAALATNILVLVIARVIQGASGAVVPLSFSIVRDEAPPREVIGAIGMLSALLAASGGVGVALGGLIVVHLGYPWLFWIPLAMTLVAGVATRLVVPASPKRGSGRISWPGALSLTAWLVALLLGVSQGPEWGWTSPAVIAMLAGAAVAIAAWVHLELRTAEPLVDMRMMRIPEVWTTNLVIATVSVGAYATFVLIPPFVQTPRADGYGFGAGVVVSGLYLLPQSGMLFVAGLMTGRVARLLGLRRTVIAGSVLSLGGLVVLALSHKSPWEIIGEGALIGFGFGFAMSAASSIVVEAVPRSQTGIATGMNANIRTIGGSVGAQVAVTIVTAGVVLGRVPAGAHYTRAFIFLAASAGIAMFASMLIPAVRRNVPPAAAAAATSKGYPLAEETRPRIVVPARGCNASSAGPR